MFAENQNKGDGLTPAADIAKRMEQLAGAAPVCSVCGGTVIGQDCSDCMERAQAAEAAKKEEAEQRERDISRLGGLLAFEDFTLARYDRKDLIAACAKYPDENLYLYGPAGTGKTHLATALVRQYPGGQVLKPQDISRKARDANKSSAAAEKDFINRVVRRKHIVIDDLGVAKDTGYSTSVLYEIIDGRVQAKAGGLIITTNICGAANEHPLDALARKLMDDRIPSRLAGICRIIEVSGKDRRLTK